MEEKSKQERARQRNWAKARVIGIAAGMLQSDYFTGEERVVLLEIKRLQGILLNNWEENTIRLGMIPRHKRNRLSDNINNEHGTNRASTGEEGGGEEPTIPRI